MKALKVAGIILIAAVVLVLILGAIAPKEIKTARFITIGAPVEHVFKTVNDLKTWEKWSAWKEQDPEMVITMGETSVGEGASYTWEGDVTETGKMSIVASDLNKSILLDIEFGSMEAAKSPWTFERTEKGTYVTWGFDAKAPYPFNAMLLFSDVGEDVGRDFERGLTKLKTLLEMEDKSRAPKQTLMEMDMPYPYMVGVRKTVKLSELQPFYAESFGSIYATLSAENIVMLGRPCGVFFSYDKSNQTADMMAAIPVGSKVNAGKAFECIAMPEGKAVVLNFYGDYANLDRARNILDNYILLKKLETKMPIIEEFVTDPTTESDPSRWLTKVMYPIK